VLPAGASDAALLDWRRGELQQLCQRCGASSMHGRSHRHLDGFQIHSTALAQVPEDHPQQLF